MTVFIDEVETSPLMRKTAWLVAGESTIRTVRILVAIVLVKFLPISEWNAVALALTIYLAALTIGSLNLGQSVLYFLPKLNRADESRLFAQTTLFLVVVALAIALTCAVLIDRIGVLAGTGSVLLIPIAIAAEIPTVTAVPALIARGDERKAGVWDLVLGTAQFVCLTFPAMMGWGVRAILMGLALASIIRLLTFLLVFGNRVVQSFEPSNKNLFVSQFVFCAPLGIAMATGVLTRLVDKWLVAWKLPLSIGTYTLAAQEIPILSVLPYASGAVVAVKMVHYFANGDSIGAFTVWNERVEAMCRPVSALTFLVVLITPEVFSIFFGPAYSSAVLPFQLFTLIGLHRVTEYGAVLRAAGRGSDVMTSSVLLLILNILFAGAGLHVQGIIGLTVGSLLAFLLAWIWILGRVASVFQLSISSVFPWSRWSQNVVLFGALSLCVEVASGMWSSTALQLVAKVLLYAAAYGLVRFFSLRHVQLRLRETSHATSNC
jgi:O-antigen/teichoic acid export membrane protein